MSMFLVFLLFFFFKQKTAYEMRISDWSSDVCSSDLDVGVLRHDLGHEAGKFQRRKTRDRGGVELVVLALLCEQLAKGPVSAITVGTDQQQAGIRSERL